MAGIRNPYLRILALLALLAGCGGGGSDGAGPASAPTPATAASTQPLLVKVTRSAQASFSPPLPQASTTGSDAFGNISGNAVLDMNGDGLQDYLVTPGYFNALPEVPVIAFKQTATGYMLATQEFFPQGAPTTGLARTPLVGDFNGDGRDDYFSADHGVEVLDANGQFIMNENAYFQSIRSGGYAASKVGPRAFNHGACQGDFDKDGDVDIVVAPLSNPQMYALRNTPSGLTYDKSPLPEELAQPGNVRPFGPSACAMADMNGDGWLDLVAAAYGDGVAGNQPNSPYATGARVFLNDKAGTFLPSSAELARPPGANWGATSIQAVDFDKNGLLDLLIPYELVEGRWALSYWLQKSPGVYEDRTLAAFSSYETQTGFWREVDVADLNGDGLPDVFFRGVSLNNDRVPYLTKLSRLFAINDGTGKFLPLQRQLLMSEMTFGAHFILEGAANGVAKLVGFEPIQHGTNYVGIVPIQLTIDFR